MPRLFLDSNILMYFLSPLSPFHQATVETLRRLGKRGAVLFIAPQSLFEFWVAATRPIADGGLGLTPAEARERVRGFVQRYPLLDDARVTWSDVLDLAVAVGIRGKRIHDARLVALMRASGLTDILSFDSHMDAFEGITRHVPTV